MNKELENIIISKYKSGLNGVELSKEIQMPLHSIYKILKKNNITRNASEAQQKYEIIDQDYFKEINSHEKSYFLGLLFADGWVDFKYNQVAIELKESDKQILTDISKQVYKDKVLNFHKSDNPNAENTYRFVMSNKIFFNDLLNLGLKPNKSKNKVFPIIKDEFINSFLLGYFDGNGCIGVGYRYDCNKPRKIFYFSIVSSKEFLESIRNVFINKLDLKENKLIKKHKQDNNIYSLNYSSKNDLIKIRDFLYKNSSLYLSRKKEIFYSL